MTTLYARLEPSRWHRSRYDTLLYYDQGCKRVQARYPYHSPAAPKEGSSPVWINNFGHPELVGLEWLDKVNLKRKG